MGKKCLLHFDLSIQVKDQNGMVVFSDQKKNKRNSIGL